VGFPRCRRPERRRSRSDRIAFLHLGTISAYNPLMQLPEYLATHFPGLTLDVPLFYRWPIGIRFELNAEMEGFTYDAAVLHRAFALYEAAFDPQDLCFLVSGRHSRLIRIDMRPSFPPHLPTIFNLSKRHKLGLPGVAGRVIIRGNSLEQGTALTLRWTQVPPRNIDYRFILATRCESIHNKTRPSSGDYVYFINRTRNIILHMYDDRGMDLIAPLAATLRPIYNRFSNWILDYDRARIEETFGHSQSEA
jgi:hypothetical protein